MATSGAYNREHFMKGICPGKPELTEKDYPDLKGKTVLVTGTSAGVGQQAARMLLEKNATVIAVNRNKEKTEKATKVIIEEVKKANPKMTDTSISERIIFISADLSDLTTIKPAAEVILSKVSQIDIAILNAGVMEPPEGSVTKQGWELQWGCNVMAHQLLIDLVTPLLKKSVASGFTPRVIFTSSMSHALSPQGGLTWDFKKTKLGSGQELYGQSKAGNVYQAAMFAQNHKDMMAFSVHPGFLASDLQRGYPVVVAWLMHKLIMHHPKFGAYTELWAALNPKITLEDSGKYVGPWGKFENLRDDISEGCTDGTAKKMYDWLETELAAYK